VKISRQHAFTGAVLAAELIPVPLLDTLAQNALRRAMLRPVRGLKTARRPRRARLVAVRRGWPKTSYFREE